MIYYYVVHLYSFTVLYSPSYTILVLGNNKTLNRMASGFCLFLCVGHYVGFIEGKGGREGMEGGREGMGGRDGGR